LSVLLHPNIWAHVFLYVSARSNLIEDVQIKKSGTLGRKKITIFVKFTNLMIMEDKQEKTNIKKYLHKLCVSVEKYKNRFG
jgi:hypothetical protein